MARIRDASVREAVEAADMVEVVSARTQLRRRERLLALLEQATAYYERCLWDSPGGESARGYLQSRSLGEETCREYRLGLAPGGQSLARKAKDKGFSAAELSGAGLVNRRG